MPGRALVVFDDRTARDWWPFTLTRPAGELRLGTLTQRERAEHALGAACIGHVADDALRGFDEPDARPVLDPAALPRDRDVVFLSSRAVPAWTAPPDFGPRPELITIAGEPCGWYAPAGSPLPPPDFFLDPARHAPEGLPLRPLDGALIERVWQFVSRNADQVARDIVALHPDAAAAELPAGVHAIGSAPLVLGRDVTIEPGVVLDLRDGPIEIQDGARVHAFTRVAGPSFIGRGSTLLGGTLSAVTLGPWCKVHGETEATVVLGYSNKAHDGFVGHAYIGCWVNLGALTTNSDLKNNYGSVRIWTPSGIADTGELKFGCLIGDHAKTAIGTLLATGTVIGTGANVFGSSSPPRYVAPFAWGTGDGATAYDLDKFLEAAEAVMARRNVPLTAGQRALLRAAWQRAQGGSP